MKKNLKPVTFEIANDPVFKNGCVRLKLNENRPFIIADPHFTATERLIRYFCWFQGDVTNDFCAPNENVHLTLEFVCDQKFYKATKIIGNAGSFSLQLWQQDAKNGIIPVSVQEFEKENEMTFDEWLVKTFKVIREEMVDSINRESGFIESQNILSEEQIQIHLTELSKTLSSQIQDYQIQYQILETEINLFHQWLNPSLPKEDSLLPMQTEIEELLRKLVHLNDLRQKNEEIHLAIEQLEKIIEKAHSEIQSEWRIYEAKLDERREKAIRVHEYEKELELHHRELIRLQKLQDKHKLILEEGLQIKFRLEQLEREMAEYKKRLTEDALAVEKLHQRICPTCCSVIDPEPADTMLITTKERMEELNNRIFNLQVEADEMRHKMKKLREQYAEQEKELHHQSTVWRQYYVTELYLQIARQQEKEYHAIKQEADRLKYLLQNRSFARKEEQAIHELQRQLDQLNYHHAHWREIIEKARHRLSKPPLDENERHPTQTQKTKDATMEEDFASILHRLRYGLFASFKESSETKQPETVMKTTEDQTCDHRKMLRMIGEGLRCIVNRKKEQSALRSRLIVHSQKMKNYFDERTLQRTEIGACIRELAELLFDWLRSDDDVVAENQSALSSRLAELDARDIASPVRRTHDPLRRFCNEIARHFWSKTATRSDTSWLIASIPFPLQDKDFIHKLHALNQGTLKEQTILLMMTNVPMATEKGISVFCYEDDGIILEMPEANR